MAAFVNTRLICSSEGEQFGDLHLWDDVEGASVGVWNLISLQVSSVLTINATQDQRSEVHKVRGQRQGQDQLWENLTTRSFILKEDAGKCSLSKHRERFLMKGEIYLPSVFILYFSLLILCSPSNNPDHSLCVLVSFQ